MTAIPTRRSPRSEPAAAPRPRPIAASWNRRCASAPNWRRKGFPSRRVRGQLDRPGTRDIFLISSGTGHGVNREVKTRLDAFLKEYGDKGRQDPDHIRFVTYTTRYNQCFWVTLDGLDRHYDRAEIDAERAGGGTQYRITTKNLTRLTLRETAEGRRNPQSTARSSR